MITKTYKLIEGRDDITLTSYQISTNEMPHNKKRKSILIFPGGGYTWCSEREADPIALAYLSKGFNTYVLRYSTRGAGYYPDQLIEASLAMKFLHDNAEELCVDTDYIFTIGFSAGGHCCAMHGTMWDNDVIFDKVDMKKSDNKPRGMMLIYPVITSGKFAHRGSFNNLLGPDRCNDPKFLKEVSLENRVTKKTPPTFIVHAFNDTTVPIENTIMFIDKLAKKKVPFECHITPTGGHGFSLGTQTVGVERYMGNAPKWVDMSIEWLNSL